ncbi:MAG: response regulator [Acidobacteriota bacterium]
MPAIAASEVERKKLVDRTAWLARKTITKAVQDSINFNDGRTMDRFGSALEQPSQEPGNGRPPAQIRMPDQTNKSAVDAQGGLKFHFTAFQHAQVTRAVLEQEQIASAIVDLDGRIQQSNRALAELLGYGHEELAGKAFEELARSAGRWNPAATTDARGGVPPVVSRLVRKSGEVVECLVDSYIICDDGSKATNFLVFVTDARARRDAEERDRLESELFRAQPFHTLGMLAGGIAHDFNNVLEVILGFAALARIRLAPADPLHEPLKIIEDSAKNAAGLARQLLDVARNDEAEKRTIDVAELIDAVMAIITRTFDRKIRIERRIDPQLPCIKGFRNRVEQAILNLCINARDAMPQGGTLAIDASSQMLARKDRRLPALNKPGPYVRIAVRDSGAGMTAEIVEQIFVPLFTTKGSGLGSGLGLAMVDRTVKEEGGFIAVNSKPGEGSEFALYLPAVFAARPCAVRSTTSQLISGRGKVLVVDDEPKILEFLETGLTRLGYDVIPAESGRQACEIYSRQWQEIDCVLLDMIMPEMNGLDTYARLREINPEARVVLSSGYSSGHVKRELGDAGNARFLEKPYTLEDLSQALDKIRQN